MKYTELPKYKNRPRFFPTLGASFIHNLPFFILGFPLIFFGIFLYRPLLYVGISVMIAYFLSAFIETISRRTAVSALIADEEEANAAKNETDEKSSGESASADRSAGGEVGNSRAGDSLSDPRAGSVGGETAQKISRGDRASDGKK